MSRPTMENVFTERKPVGPRDAVDAALIEIVEADDRVVVLSADMGGSIPALRDRHPDRYIEFGIAETNTISAAAGLAACGMVPYVVSMAPFGMVKCAEQIRTDLAYNRLPVRIITRLSGIAMGYFGPSHHCVEDIAIARAIPNLTFVASCDDHSTTALIRGAADHPGPMVIRVGAGANRVVYDNVPDLATGRLVGVLRPARPADVCVIATGTGVTAALGAADLLEAEGIALEVLDTPYLKPLDEAGIIDAMSRTGAILTVEEHNVAGGLGTAVAEVLARNRVDGRLVLHGLPDDELAVADPATLLEHYGISPDGVAAKIRELLT